MKLDDVKANVKAENEGDWVNSPNWPDVWCKVRSIRNPDYRRAEQIQRSKWRRKFGDMAVPIEQTDQAVAKMMVDHILLDLSGIDEFPEYDKQIGMEIFTNPELRPLADFIAWAAQVVGEQEDTETDSKNSPRGSASKQK